MKVERPTEHRLRRHLYQILMMLLLVSGVGVATSSASAMAQTQQQKQSQLVTLNHPNSTAGAVLKDIEKQTGLRFFFNNNALNLRQKVAIVAKDEPLTSVLDRLLGQGYTYKFDKNLIILSPKSAERQGKVTIYGVVTDETNEPMPSATVLEQGTQNGMTTDAEGRFIPGLTH